MCNVSRLRQQMGGMVAVAVAVAAAATQWQQQHGNLQFKFFGSRFM